MVKQKIISKYLGIPYKNNGRSMEGLDCWGLIKLIYKDMGYDLFDLEEGYDMDWSKKGKNYFIDNYHKDWTQYKTPKFLDVVLFKNGKDIVNHAGIFLDSNRFMHTCKAGTVISRLSDARWENKLEGFYRLKKGLSCL